MNARFRAPALAAVLVTMAAPAFAADTFTQERRATARHVDRYGDPTLGDVIRTDERYNTNTLFPGPRGWFYWNLLEDPKPYQDPKMALSGALGPDTVLPTSILFDAEGKEVWRYSGDLDWTSSEAAILLSEAAAPAKG